MKNGEKAEFFLQKNRDLKANFFDRITMQAKCHKAGGENMKQKQQINNNTKVSNRQTQGVKKSKESKAESVRKERREVKRIAKYQFDDDGVFC